MIHEVELVETRILVDGYRGTADGKLYPSKSTKRIIRRASERDALMTVAKPQVKYTNPKVPNNRGYCGPQSDGQQKS